MDTCWDVGTTHEKVGCLWQLRSWTRHPGAFIRGLAYRESYRAVEFSSLLVEVKLENGNITPMCLRFCASWLAGAYREGTGRKEDKKIIIKCQEILLPFCKGFYLAQACALHLTPPSSEDARAR